MCFERSVVRSQAKARYFRSFCRLIIPWPSLFLLPEQQEAGAASLFVRRPLIFSSSTLPHSRLLLLSLSLSPLSPAGVKYSSGVVVVGSASRNERESPKNLFPAKSSFSLSIRASGGWDGSRHGDDIAGKTAGWREREQAPWTRRMRVG